MRLSINIRKLHDDARIPTYATAGAAGFDLVAVEDVIIEPGETALVRTGLAFEIPPGFEMQIRPRSGISLRTKLRIANAPGTIDSDFRGEVGVIVDNISKPHPRFFLRHPPHWNISASREGTYIVRKGDRIAQAVIAPVIRTNFEVADELTETERGDGGFGHSGVRSEVIE